VITRLVRFLAFIGFSLALLAPGSHAAVKLPPTPAAHFNDYAGFVSADHARSLDARLAQFERETSNQLLVVIYPRLPAGTALEDYTVRAAQAWGVGRKDRDNGAVLFIFAADRLLRIEVGYGLEGTLTDAVAHTIIENELKPRLRAGDPGSALDAAVTAMIAATKGEYRGTGRTHAEGSGSTVHPSTPRTNSGGSGLIAIIILFAIIGSLFGRGNHTYGHGRRPRFGGWSGGGGSWGGRSGGGGGGGFSGGGGSFGGGGASGKW
jgi:uncharacterized protein